MKKKFMVIGVAALAAISLMFAACVMDPDMNHGGGDEIGEGVWWRVDPDSGERLERFSGTRVMGQGNGYSGGIVRLFVTFAEGIITDVDFQFFGQTPAYIGVDGSRVRSGLTPWIIDNNALDFRVDIVSHATITVTGLRNGADALVTREGIERLTAE